MPQGIECVGRVFRCALITSVRFYVNNKTIQTVYKQTCCLKVRWYFFLKHLANKFEKQYYYANNFIALCIQHIHSFLYMIKSSLCKLKCNFSDSLDKEAIIFSRRQIWTTNKKVNHTFCVDLLQLFLSEVCNYLVERSPNLPGKFIACMMTSFSL